jgi:hypothetical protein
VLIFATQLSQSRRQNRDRELLISGSICREFRWEPEAFENRKTREQNLIQTSEAVCKPPQCIPRSRNAKAKL